MANDVQLDHPFFEKIKGEHEELVGLLQNVASMLGAGTCDREEISPLLDQICNLLASHFECEERGGYLRQALIRAPRLTEKAGRLQSQHAPLLEEARAIFSLACEGGGGDAPSISLLPQFTAFAESLVRHESRENELVQEAFTTDLGSGD